MLKKPFRLLGRLRISDSHLDNDSQFKEIQPTLAVPKSLSRKSRNISVTTDPDLFQKRVAELRLALATPEREKA